MLGEFFLHVGLAGNPKLTVLAVAGWLIRRYQHFALISYCAVLIDADKTANWDEMTVRRETLANLAFHALLDYHPLAVQGSQAQAIESVAAGQVGFG